MKILLMNVPDRHVGKTTSDWDLEASDIGVFPPVGLMCLAAAVRRAGGHEVRIVDNILNRATADDIVLQALDFKPDVIGMTTYTPLLYDTILLSDKVRQALPGTVIVWGGPHTMLFPEESLEHACVDYLFLGEAEETFPLFCDALEVGKPLDAIPGICYRRNGKFYQTGPAAYVAQIDSLPFPAFDLLDFRRYFSAIGTGQTVGTICSSRGCPYHCTFCCKPYATYRSRSVENIMAEMELYYREGVREFFFFDDLFNLTADRVKKICRAILERQWKICWSFRGRVDGIDEEMLALSKRAGCRQIFYGVEAGTDEGLKAIKKGIKIEDAHRAVQMTRKAGIASSTNWIIGFPHHKTTRDVMDLINTAVKIDSDYAQFNICIAYHGTEIFNEGVQRNLFNADIWRQYVRRPVPHFVEPIWEQYLSRKELSQLLKLCYRRFYLRPVVIVRKLRSIRSWKEFLLHVKAALTIFGLGGYHREKQKKDPVCGTS